MALVCLFTNHGGILTMNRRVVGAEVVGAQQKSGTYEDYSGKMRGQRAPNVLSV